MKRRPASCREGGGAGTMGIVGSQLHQSRRLLVLPDEVAHSLIPDMPLLIAQPPSKIG